MTGTNAQAVSRTLRRLGWATVPDHTRQGLRVMRGLPGTAEVVAQYNNQAKAERQAGWVAEALREAGYEVEVNSL